MQNDSSTLLQDLCDLETHAKKAKIPIPHGIEIVVVGYQKDGKTSFNDSLLSLKRSKAAWLFVGIAWPDDESNASGETMRSSKCVRNFSMVRPSGLIS